MKTDVKRALEHIHETDGIRRIFWHMDDGVKGLKYGIKQGDDAVVVGEYVYNAEGPYPLKIGRKTGLIHTICDVVVMGARPLFAFDCMQVNSVKEAEEVALDLKKQAAGLGVPILGGNTQLENNLTPCVSFAVVGKLTVKKPIPDNGSMVGDRVLMLGEVVEGEIGERVYRAKVKFETYFELIKKIRVHASKDCSRGGWFGNLVEMISKSRLGVDVKSIPNPRLTRYMGTYLIAVDEKDVDKVLRVASKHKCPVVEVGVVAENPVVKLAGKTVVNKKRMRDLSKSLPYRSSRSA